MIKRERLFGQLQESFRVCALGTAGTSIRMMLCLAALALMTQALMATEAVKITKAESAIVIDGKLDEAAWAQAEKITPFFVNDQGTPKPAKEQTSVRLLYTGEGIYIGVECLESRMDALKSQPREKDGRVWEDDCVEIFLQPPKDALAYYHFIVNAAGSKYDSQNLKEATMESRPGWEGEWEAKTSRKDNAWFVEAYIPFAGLGLQPGGGNAWHINVARERKAGIGEDSSFCAGLFHEPVCFAELKGLEVDFAPYYLVLEKFNVETALRKGNAMSAVLNAEIANKSGADRALKGALDIIPLGGDGKPVTESLSLELKKDTTKSLSLNCDIAKGGLYAFSLYLLDAQTKKPYLVSIRKIMVESFTPMALRLDKPSYRNTILSSMKLDEVAGTVNVFTEDKEVLKDLKIKLSLCKAGDEKKIWSEEHGNLACGENAFKIKSGLIEVGEYLITAELLDKAGQKIGSAVCPLRRELPAKNEVWVENHTVMINGKPFFPIGFYAVSETDLEELSKLGANFIWYTGSSWGMENTLKFADEAAKNNIKVWYSAGHSLIGASGYPGKGKVEPGKKLPVSLDQLSEEQLAVVEQKTREEIPKLREHPALLGWWILEESFLPATVAERVAKIYRELDPYHPIAITHNNGEAAGNYKDAYEIFAIWSYPRFYKGRDADITEPTTRLRSVWRQCGENKCVFLGPSMHVIGRWAARTDFSQREPTYREVRNETYQGIVNGAKGMIYIFYKHPHCGSINSMPGMWNGVKRCISELNSLVPGIVDETVAGKAEIRKGKEDIQILLKKHAGEYYLFAVNTATNRVEAEIAFDGGLDIRKLRVVSEDRTVKVKANRLQDVFETFETHIYTTSAKDFDLATTRKIEAECDKLQAEFREQHKANLASEFLGTTTEPRYAALNDNDEFTSCAPSSTFKDVFSLPFPIEIIFTEPKALGKVVIKSKGSTAKDFELEQFDAAANGWKKLQPREVLDEQRENLTRRGENLSITTYLFEPVTTARLRVVLPKRSVPIYEIEAYH